MLGLLELEFVVGIVAYAVCLADDFAARRWRTRAGRQMIAAALVILGEFMSLLLVSRGTQVPLWIFIVGFAAADAVAISWVVLRWRARRTERRDSGTG